MWSRTRVVKIGWNSWELTQYSHTLPDPSNICYDRLVTLFSTKKYLNLLDYTFKSHIDTFFSSSNIRLSSLALLRWTVNDLKLSSRVFTAFESSADSLTIFCWSSCSVFWAATAASWLKRYHRLYNSILYSLYLYIYMYMYFSLNTN